MYSTTLLVSSNTFLQIHFGSFNCVYSRAGWTILLKDNDLNFYFYSLFGQNTWRLAEKKNHFTLQLNWTCIVKCNNMFTNLKIVQWLTIFRQGHMNNTQSWHDIWILVLFVCFSVALWRVYQSLKLPRRVFTFGKWKSREFDGKLWRTFLDLFNL